jgi:hypothetical protein
MYNQNMKLATIKNQIDAYFDNVNPQELVQRFEALGYEFEIQDDVFTFPVMPVSDDPNWSFTEITHNEYIYVNNNFLNYAMAA